MTGEVETCHNLFHTSCLHTNHNSKAYSHTFFNIWLTHSKIHCKYRAHYYWPKRIFCNYFMPKKLQKRLRYLNLSVALKGSAWYAYSSMFSFILEHESRVQISGRFYLWIFENSYCHSLPHVTPCSSTYTSELYSKW